MGLTVNHRARCSTNMLLRRTTCHGLFYWDTVGEKNFVVCAEEQGNAVKEQALFCDRQEFFCC